ncbi:hypothetical protein ColTof4_12445 [Colletotrichum tofieldiae]|nr:hypothetical protein ColTof3_06603 [Colletotrichum tofieldiae]GKT80022.1 hypothetical protein ColTof4_12445 [Colletotrichum tofieldiae]GKT85421.1 hypothetical protein Ct61P_03271 [Colletotrichum tofieldiae]
MLKKAASPLDGTRNESKSLPLPLPLPPSSVAAAAAAASGRAFVPVPVLDGMSREWSPWRTGVRGIEGPAALTASDAHLGGAIRYVAAAGGC